MLGHRRDLRRDGAMAGGKRRQAFRQKEGQGDLGGEVDGPGMPRNTTNSSPEFAPQRMVEVDEERVALAHKKKNSDVSEVCNINTKRMEGKGRGRAAGVNRGSWFPPAEPSALRGGSTAAWGLRALMDGGKWRRGNRGSCKRGQGRE